MEEERPRISGLLRGTHFPTYALKQHVPQAVSSSLGSNIFDSSVGLPIPWALYCAVYRKSFVSVDVTGMGWSVFVLMLMILLLFVVFIASRWTLSHAGGAAMFVAYAVFLVQALLTAFGVWTPPFGA